MSGRSKVQKASDVFNNTDFVFAKKSPFEEVFPEIENLKVEVIESGEGVSEWSRKHVYLKEHFPGEYINCSNSLCYNGGFSVGSFLRDMVRNKQTDLDGSKLCQGNEGSPKGRRIYRKCLNSFKIHIEIKYRRGGPLPDA